jgi:glycine/D-amino acid oxidase-like deaminating enzyme
VELHNSVYREGVKLEPFWWEDAPPAARPATDMPAKADVLIVGGGYSGLSAALTLSTAGRAVVVADAGTPGAGASSRNGGAVGETLRVSFATMLDRWGPEIAVGFYQEVKEARSYLEHLISSDAIECDYAKVGRFIGCHAPKFYVPLARDLELRRKLVGFEAEMIPRAEQHRVIGSDAYYGGRLILSDANLHPAKLHRGLLDRVLAAGATVIGQTRVTGIQHDGGAINVLAGEKRISAGTVIVCTNGYTGKEMGWLRRRLIPIQSQIIATEPLAPEVVQRLIPRRRQLGDTCNLHYYYRTSPDGRRILFGGRAGAHAIDDPRRSGRHLYKRLIALFPELTEIRITHSWAGFIAYTFDHLQHMRQHEGVHYVSGCCGSGVALQTWLGHKTALKILGRADARSMFDRPYPTRPLYTGKPWFLPAAVFYYGLRDRLGI